MSWTPVASVYTVAYDPLGDSQETWDGAAGGIASFSTTSAIMDFGLARLSITPFALNASSMSYASGFSWPLGPRSIATMSSHLRKLYPQLGSDIEVLFEYKVDDVATWWVTEDLPIQIWPDPFQQPPAP